ncbi:hypothetical protein DK419_27080 [Methylobacterium terrae]|uniref:Uncharacterized protein n=1 Tax=Methylobacterium terrae TaxID=2202827 RepID=A0A2U8WVS8_9HYPH|nr:hypothetical protein DK419_27080 [Methylobacterium terrae]
MQSDADWKWLRNEIILSGDEAIAGSDGDRAVDTIISLVSGLPVTTVVIEEFYIDRDFSDEYRAFYGRLFRQYQRETRRLHFFADNLTVPLEGNYDHIASGLEESAARGRYLGFVVLRPIRDAPIARAVLSDTLVGPALPESTVQVRTTYTAHLLGASLPVRTVPFTQQDRHMSSCSQAAAWVCARHFHTRHAEPWFSMARIREAVDHDPDAVAVQSIPAGSEGLNVVGLQRVLRRMGRQPYFMSTTSPDGKKVGSDDLICALHRYVGSGIPVIAVIKTPNSGDAHAVVVVGMTHGKAPSKGGMKHATTAIFVDKFIVHDDQRGPFTVLPREGGTNGYDLRNVPFIIVPLPESVVVRAEAAELKAFQALEDLAKGWHEVCDASAPLLGTAPENGEPFFAALAAGRVLARTYLTSGWKYQARLARNIAHPNLKYRILTQSLPKLIWVTEFGIVDNLEKPDPTKRLIYAHCVVDAMSTGNQAPPIMIHVPGFLYTWVQGSDSFYPSHQLAKWMVADDRPYRPRARFLDRS